MFWGLPVPVRCDRVCVVQCLNKSIKLSLCLQPILEGLIDKIVEMINVDGVVKVRIYLFLGRARKKFVDKAREFEGMRRTCRTPQ